MNPAMPRAPIRSLALSDAFGGLGATYVGAEIDAGGALVISSEESAAMCEAMRGDLDTDQWLSVAVAWKDELLLRLLADRFRTVADLRTYLGTHGIPSAGFASGRERS
jgi:hypothetical protein